MTDSKALQTIRDMIRFATSKFNENGLFFGHGTDNAWDEAAALVFHTLHLSHELGGLVFDAHLTEKEKNTILTLIEKRITTRVPLAYLTHEALFAGLSFYVDERVLIPRSPFAELIANQFEPWVDPSQTHAILDLCTGSGCIAIALAKAFPEAQVDASDISQDALAVANINALRHHLEDQITFYQSDLFESIPKKQYDLIVSNPPYVDAKDMAALPKEYSHEPVSGLAAGQDGLDYAVKIIQQSAKYLSPHGILFVEVGNSEAALVDKFPNIPFTWIEFENGGGGVFMLTHKDIDFLT